MRERPLTYLIQLALPGYGFSVTSQRAAYIIEISILQLKHAPWSVMDISTYEVPAEKWLLNSANATNATVS